MGRRATGAIDPRPFESEIEKIVHQVQETDQANQGWLAKQEKLTRLRFGHRRQRNVPWKGSSNITVPIIDKTIRRWRPPMASLILDAEPVALFTPQEAQDFDKARTTEPYFTWMFRHQMKTTRSVVHLLDTLGMRGHTYAREGWHYQTHRQSRVVPAKDIFPQGIDAAVGQAAEQTGETVSPLDLASRIIAERYDMPLDNEQAAASVFQAASAIVQGADFGRLIKISLHDDRPSWVHIDSINTITTVDQRPEEADFFCIVHPMGRQKIEQMTRDGYFIPPVAAELLKSLRSGNHARPENTPADSMREAIRRVMDRQAEITTDPRQNTAEGDTRIWELFARLDIDGDGIDERVVIWYAPAEKLILQLFEYPFPFDTWPITPFEFSVDSNRIIDNRGIPEMIAAFQKIASAMQNQRIDAGAIMLAPSFKQKISGSNLKRSINWGPGGINPVTDMNDLQPIVHDLRLLGALLQEQQVGQALAEDYVGTFDATIGRLQDQNAPERRTATEVSAIQNVASSVFGLDAKLFVEQMSHSFNKIWNLYQEWGQDETFFRVSGENSVRNVRKSEIGRNYDIRAAGTPANTQKQVLLANYQTALQLALSDRSGVVNLPEILRAYLKILDPIVASQAIRSPEEAAQVQTIQQAADITEPDANFGGL